MSNTILSLTTDSALIPLKNGGGVYALSINPPSVILLGINVLVLLLGIITILG